MKRLLLLILIVFAITGLQRPSISQAQTINVPLVMLIEGDLWTWNPQTGALVQLTTWRYNFKPVMSPNGDWVAYKSWAQIAVEAINANAPLDAVEPPGNIWLIDPRTGDAKRIAEQPADVRFASSDGNDRFISRSNPTWSPDGTQIAWTEFLFPEYTSRLVVYTLSDQTTRTLVNELPISYEQQGPLDVAWGALGFAYLNINYNQSINDFEESYIFYDNNGRRINTITIPYSNAPLHGYFWFTGTEFVNGMENGLAVINGDTLPLILNPNNGRTTEFMGLLVGYSGWQTPAQSVYLNFENYALDFEYGLIWRPLTANGRFLDSIGTSISYFDTFAKVAMSPDGQSIAYIAEDGGVLVWTNGRLVQLRVSNVQALAWSPIIWTTNYPVSG